MQPSTTTLDASAVPAAAALARRYRQVRQATEQLCRPLAIEDYVVQAMPDASPAKWHLAHTTWFFEVIILAKALAGYRAPDERFHYLFNSYYLSLGERHCRAKRGLITRPTVEEVYRYRQQVDEQMLEWIQNADATGMAQFAPLIEIGLHHEQQHQELLLTDIKYLLACNPLYPVYHAQQEVPPGQVPPMRWLSFDEGMHWIGHEGDDFAYDNETPRHRLFVNRFHIASRPVTNADYLAFIADGGYQRGELWLSLGWSTVEKERWTAPLYWEQRDGEWWMMTLSGLRRVEPNEPVCHVSYFEADAFARWAGARLPTEAEWEVTSADQPIDGNFVESGLYHPHPTGNVGTGLTGMFGDVWEWTGSAYLPYPGYRPLTGPLGEYNGKFMCNQFVLRGGSCATPRSHIRRTYRNFFPPDARWQFTGLRLAKDAQ
jgi:ergothioneine biosynthesis protein EgtB